MLGYLALLICAYAFMFSASADNELKGLYLLVLTLPWGFLILPLAMIFPTFMGQHGDAVGQIFFSLGAAINFYAIHWIFRAIERNNNPRITHQKPQISN
jgi:hypothetical protein